MNTPQDNTKISILAGNPLIDDPKGAPLRHETQLIAFGKAMQIASENRDRIGRIYITFDHKGRFSRFLEEGTSKRRRKSPRLSNLMQEVRGVYEGTARQYDISLDEIYVMTEEQLRMRMLQLIETREVLKKAISSEDPVCEKFQCDLSSPSDRKKKVRINCTGITAAIVDRMNKYGTPEIFVEFDPIRCREDVFTQAPFIAEGLLGAEKRKAVHMYGMGGGVSWRKIY